MAENVTIYFIDMPLFSLFSSISLSLLRQEWFCW
jgi:hypothetical protein